MLPTMTMKGCTTVQCTIMHALPPPSCAFEWLVRSADATHMPRQSSDRQDAKQIGPPSGPLSTPKRNEYVTAYETPMQPPM